MLLIIKICISNKITLLKVLLGLVPEGKVSRIQVSCLKNNVHAK